MASIVVICLAIALALLVWNFLIAGGFASVFSVAVTLALFGADPTAPLVALVGGVAAFALVCAVRGWTFR